MNHFLGEVELARSVSARSTVVLVFISLMEAVDRFKQEPGSPGNAYGWYRQYAARYGTVPFSDHRVTAIKHGRQWMVDEFDLEAALISHREQRGHLDQMTADYNSHILHPGTVRTVGGGYTTKGAFHFRWNDIERALMKSEGFWRCNNCWASAVTEHNREECHLCRDWGSCGSDCTLDRIACSTCRTSATM